MKQQIEQLIDRLASKELTKGCIFTIYGGPHKLTLEIVRSEGPRLLVCNPKRMDYTEMREETVHRYKTLKILGHDIFLGDVLEKMKARFYKLPEVAPSHEKAVEWRYNYAENKRLLTNLWEEVGFTKSAQSILSEAVWEEEPCECTDYDVCATCYANEEGRVRLVLKDKNIRSLFTLLLQLFPKP